MRSRRYYLTRSIVRALFWLSMLAGLYLVATGIWWDGGGWCLGSATSCAK